jgi:hypothetical protein
MKDFAGNEIDVPAVLAGIASIDWSRTGEADPAVIRIDRRAWWCSCGAHCLNTEGSFDEHRGAQ